jgi:hypothetical protein
MRDATGQVPVYTSLNKQTKNGQKPVVQLKNPDKRGLAYETVAVPIQVLLVLLESKSINRYVI